MSQEGDNDMAYCTSTSDDDYLPSESESGSTVSLTLLGSDTVSTEDELTHVSPSDYSEKSSSFSPIEQLDFSDSEKVDAAPLRDSLDEQRNRTAASTSAEERVRGTAECTASQLHDDESRRAGGTSSTSPSKPPNEAQSTRKRLDSGIGDSPGKVQQGMREGGQQPVTQVRRKRNTVYCFFCEEPVLQFARHLLRHHESELEVQRIKAAGKKSLERKRLLSVLRNKGNYLLSKVNNLCRPVRKPMLKGESSAPLPCNRCYGYFAKKQLWRHVRRCPASKRTSAPHSHNLAQNMMLNQVEGNDFLKTNVFPHMRVDVVTEAVKLDPLICAYGARFAKTHGQKHQVNFISRKMRELAKLLIALKAADSEIKSLVDALTPSRYQLLVQCAKKVAGYDQGLKRYSSPTYAMNIQTSLKECCQIACNFLYQHANYPDKKSYEEAEFPFIRLMGTINAEWKYDVSHQAANDLQAASMNKITIVPLASDLYHFRQYLVNLANESYAALQYDEKDIHAYRNLTESVYCRVMLLCRKRCGELSRLPVDVYLKSGERNSYEEFVNAIRPSEMVLVRKFKRVVIQGKRKCTPVIFTDDVQRHIDMLLRIRDNFVPRSNVYLFGNDRTDNPISGYKVIKKHASNANLVHPEAMTTRLLRKHLATVSQVLTMSDQDIEQLAAFMGHTGQVHRNEYRLPDDIFQTAKVSKLLLMMEAGQAAQYKGKTLDEIELDLSTDVVEEAAEIKDDDEDDDDEFALDDSIHELNVFQPSTSQAGSSRVPSSSSATTERSPAMKQKSQVKKFDRKIWSEDEKRLVLEFFSANLTEKRPPKRRECERLTSLYPDIFTNRPWQKVKAYVVNTYSKRTS